VDIPQHLPSFAGNPPDMGVLMQAWQLSHPHLLEQETT